MGHTGAPAVVQILLDLSLGNMIERQLLRDMRRFLLAACVFTPVLVLLSSVAFHLVRIFIVLPLAPMLFGISVVVTRRWLWGSGPSDAKPETTRCREE